MIAIVYLDQIYMRGKELFTPYCIQVAAVRYMSGVVSLYVLKFHQPLLQVSTIIAVFALLNNGHVIWFLVTAMFFYGYVIFHDLRANFKYPHITIAYILV